MYFIFAGVIEIVSEPMRELADRWIGDWSKQEAEELARQRSLTAAAKWKTATKSVMKLQRQLAKDKTKELTAGKLLKKLSEEPSIADGADG